MKINQIPTPSISIILKEEFLEPLCITPYRLATWCEFIYILITLLYPIYLLRKKVILQYAILL